LRKLLHHPQGFTDKFTILEFVRVVFDDVEIARWQQKSDKRSWPTLAANYDIPSAKETIGKVASSGSGDL
jgi:hypothetical protein